METPLLNGAAEEGHGGGDGDYPPLRSWREVRSMVWTETVKLWRVAGPLAFQILCQFGTNSMTTVIVGHIGNIELSAVSISLSVIGTFSFGFMLGMGSALETLCGQAFGAGQVQLLGVYLQRSWIILLVTCIILLPLYIFATPILKALGQEDEIADLAGQFTIETIPQLFSLAISFPTQKFLQAQSKVNVQATIAFVALILHIGMLVVFIFVFGWGTTGAAIAYDISNWMIAVSQVVYAIGWCKEGWTGLTWSAFREIWAFVRLSLASAVMLCLEIWYFMIIILLTGHLQNAVIAVGSLSICMNFNGWEAMLFIGMNAAVSIRVSNELGYGHPRAAKYSVYVAVSQSLLIGIFCMVVVLLARDYIAFIFTSNKEMQEAVSHLAYLLGITMLLNSMQPVISGVAVGGGWQALVAYINLGCYYILGIPLGYLLGYKANLGVQGLWGGMICGAALQTLILLFIVYRTNWNKEVEQTTERMQKWGGQRIEADDLGMGSALETLCGQAYSAGQVQLLGVYLQRSWIILLVTCIILLPIYIFATPILKVLGKEDEIADLAGQFTIETIPQVVYAIGWCKEGWTGLTWSAFREIWAFARLSLASAVMLWGAGTLGGMKCGTASQTLILLFIVYRTNWNREVDQTTERMQKWGGQRIEDDDV